MSFTEITILEVDFAHVKACSGNDAVVPHILSDNPLKNGRVTSKNKLNHEEFSELFERTK